MSIMEKTRSAADQLEQGLRGCNSGTTECKRSSSSVILNSTAFAIIKKIQFVLFIGNLPLCMGLPVTASLDPYPQFDSERYHQKSKG